MKKVLFITQSYPSVRSANVLCDDMVIQRLLEKSSAEIHCLCMRYDGQPLEEDVGGVHVHRFRVGPLFEFEDRALGGKDPNMMKLVHFLERVQLRIAQLVTIPIYPCICPLKTAMYVRESEKAYSRYGFDIVACEHFGFETMMAGLRLKKRHPELRYIQFFWDALSAGIPAKYLPRAYVDKKRRALEAHVFATADVSVALNSHRGELEKRSYAVNALASGRLCYLGIPNLENVSEKVGNCRCDLFVDDTRNIVYAGSTSGRDVDFIVRVVRETGDPNLRLWFFTSSDLGGIDLPVGKSGPRVIVHPYIPHEELLKVLVNADALLNLGNADSSAIPSKVTQYIGCRRPIISTFSIESDTSKELLSNYPASLFLDERRTDYPVIATELTAFIDEASSPIAPYDDLAELYRSSLPDAYCDLFNLPAKKLDF